MEIGDLFYIIILSLFMILGFFNDSRKKKNEQKQQSLPKTHTYQSDEPEVIPPLYKKITPPDPNTIKRKKSLERKTSNKYSKEGNIVFQSSVQNRVYYRFYQYALGCIIHIQHLRSRMEGVHHTAHRIIKRYHNVVPALSQRVFDRI